MIKKLKYAFAYLVLSFAFIACDDDNIDPINTVAQGTDSAAPVVTITSPSGNLLIPFTDTKTDFSFIYAVTDDIEIKSVDVFLDGVKIKNYATFLDYRALKETYVYKNLGLGNHTLRVDAVDMTGKTATKSFTFNISNTYVAKYPGEKLYIPFGSGNSMIDILGGKVPTRVGNGTTAAGFDGSSYVGATDSYFSIPLTADLYSTTGMSFTFRYKVNASPDRSGIITINDDADNANDNRTGGMRLFREGSGASQTVKLNLGLGTAGESWNDGGNITVANNAWVHIAVTIANNESKIYFNGVLQRTATYTTPFNFSQSTTIVFGSGDPSFTYWGHKADSSSYDDVRIYNKALTAAEVTATMN